MPLEANSETMSAHICSNSYLFFKCGFSSTNRRKISSACVIMLLLFLQETLCQDKQRESTHISSDDVSHGATLIPRLYSCCDKDKDLPRSGNTTTDPSSSEVSNCKLRNTEIDILNMISTTQNASRNFTIQRQTKKMRCPNAKPVIIHVDENVEEEQKQYKTETENTLLGNGYLKVGIEYYAPDEFCVHKITETEVEFLVCPTDCKKRLCVRKCCGLDKLLSLRLDKPPAMGCEYLNVPGNNFRPPMYRDYSTKLAKAEEDKLPMPHYSQTPLSSFKANCFNNATNLAPYSQTYADKINNHTGRNTLKFEFRLRIDGVMLSRHLNGECETHAENFCMDGIQTFGSDSTEPFKNSEDEIVVVSCAVKPETSDEDPISQIYGPLMLSVSIFPFLTTVVYVLLWKKQTVHGWTIVSTSTSLLFMYIFIGTSHVLRMRYGTSVHYTKGCVFVAVAAHFFFLSTFAWLTIMCFDLWWTFRTLAPRNRQSKGTQRFINYIIFGWGVPTLIITVSLVIHFMEDNCNEHLIVPAYGSQSCYLTGRAMGVYLYYPSIAFLTINLIFFSVTCHKLYQYRQSCQMANKTDMKECFSRFTKLFFVMGVTWMFEIISWAIGGLGFTWYWAIFDIINILRAAAVFVIYVCKRDIFASLEESYPQLKNFSGDARQSMNSEAISKDGTTTTTVTAPNSMPMPSTSTAPSETNSTDYTKL